jgi:hypothetical protein
VSRYGRVRIYDYMSFGGSRGKALGGIASHITLCFWSIVLLYHVSHSFLCTGGRHDAKGSGLSWGREVYGSS